MNFKRLTTTALAASVIATGLAATSIMPAEAAAKNTVRATPAKPIINEKFAVTGKLGTSVKRKTYLQFKSAGKWKTTDTDRTSAAGAYKFTGRTKVDRDFRVVAPKTSIKGKTYKRITGPTKRIKVVEQTATIKVSNPTPRVGEVIKVTGTFTPARKGRKVVAVITFDGGSFNLEPRKQTSSGQAVWHAIAEAGDVGHPSAFAAHADSFHGAAKITSQKVTVTAIE
ncbi:hypothetical protein [Aeromicrobium sp. P5_D10]